MLRGPHPASFRRPRRFRPGRVVVALVLAMALSIGAWGFPAHRGPGGGSPPIPPSPPGGDAYGLTNGEQWARDIVVPLAVTKPLGAEDIPVGQLTQAKLNTLGVGAKLWVLAGTHTASGLQPLQNQEIVHAPGAIVDAANAGEFIYAGPAAGVKIRGGRLRRCGNALSSSSASAILVTGGATKGGWLVEDVEVDTHFNRGVHFAAPNCVARRVYSHDNGRYNFTASTNTTAPGEPRYTGCRIELSWSKNGNTRQLNPGDDAGASKFGGVNGLYIGFNVFEDTTSWGGGYGIWPDFDHRDMIIEENLCVGTSGAGIFYEASFGGTVIRRNTIIGCGKDPSGAQDDWLGACGILLSCCDGTLGGATNIVDVYRNLVDTGTTGALAIGLVFHYGHPYYSRNNKFRENLILARGTRAGVIGGRWHQLDANLYGKDPTFNPFVGKGNDWISNVTRVPVGGSGAPRWQYAGTSPGVNQTQTYPQFQALGQDVAGQLIADL